MADFLSTLKNLPPVNHFPKNSSFVHLFKEITIFKKKKAEENCIRFFDRRTFFTVYGEDAILIAKTYNKTTGTLKHLGESQIPYQTIQSRQMSGMLKDLIEKKHSFEIWSNKGHRWECVQKGSPGNFENFDYEGEGDSGSVIMAVSIGKQDNNVQIGVAYVDQITCTFGISEFVDSEKLCNLEIATVQLGAREVLVQLQETRFPVSVVRQVFDKCDVAITEQKQKAFKTNNIEQDLRRLVSSEAHPNLSFQLDMRLAMSSLAALISFLELLNDDTNHGAFNIVTFDLKNYMRLDAAAMQALNLVPTPTDANKSMNLFGRLNSCKTAMGSRKLMQWIKQPLLDEKEISNPTVFFYLAF